MQPRRSLLYMPGANARALEKARTLDCDTIIFDLEDAVAPDAKADARRQVLEAITEGGYGYRELVVRCNGLDTPWGLDDLGTFAGMELTALLFPKVSSAAQLEDIVAGVNEAGGEDMPIWIMIETPQGVLDLAEFAWHERVGALVMGTSDLVKELGATHEPDRSNLAYALQHCVLVARRYGKDIFDGVHLDFKNEASFAQVCANGAAMGFDGKTLIHPTQIAEANRAFGFSEEDVAQAHRLLEVWQAALAEGKGVAVLDGKLVENLHAAQAEKIVAFADAIAARSR